MNLPGAVHPEAIVASTSLHPRGRIGPILAVGCSSLWCSVALVSHAGGQSVNECWSEPAGVLQSERLLQMIGNLMSSHELAPAELSLLVHDAGPGAFTSLRVACSVVQGIAFAANAPVVSVGSTEAIALQAARGLGPGRHLVLVVIDARMNEVYAALVEVELGPDLSLVSIGEIAPCIVGRPEDVVARLQAGLEANGGHMSGPLLLAGDAITRIAGLSDRLLQQTATCGGLPRLGRGGETVRADALAAIGVWRCLRGEAVDPALVGPRYIRNKVALDVDEQSALRASAGLSPGRTR